MSEKGKGGFLGVSEVSGNQSIRNCGMECEEGLKVLYALHKGEVQVEMHGGGHGPVQQEGLGPDGRPGRLWGKEKLQLQGEMILFIGWPVY